MYRRCIVNGITSNSNSNNKQSFRNEALATAERMREKYWSAISFNVRWTNWEFPLKLQYAFDVGAHLSHQHTLFSGTLNMYSAQMPIVPSQYSTAPYLHSRSSICSSRSRCSNRYDAMPKTRIICTTLVSDKCLKNLPHCRNIF